MLNIGTRTRNLPKNSNSKFWCEKFQMRCETTIFDTCEWNFGFEG